MALDDKAQQVRTALLDKIEKKVANASPSDLRDLAEAYSLVADTDASTAAPPLAERAGPRSVSVEGAGQRRRDIL
jgi:hypothetical protein